VTQTQEQTEQPGVDPADSPLEDSLEEAFSRTVAEGTQRLHRRWSEVLVTGFFGGTEVAFGVLALIAVREATGSPLLGGLAFSVGFLALLLGRSELFTEGFYVPIMTLVAHRASGGQLAKLWGGTLLGNLAGGWLIMWIVMAAFPRYHAVTVQLATPFATAPLSRESICLALIAGAAITLMTRMQHGTDAMVGKIAAAVAGAFLLAGLGMFHSILDSLLIFGALHTGTAPFGYLDWLRWFSYTVVGNVVGGLVLVTLLRVVRSKGRLQMEREAAHAE
jgi:formate-nitrite transporter family protein